VTEAKLEALHFAARAHLRAPIVLEKAFDEPGSLARAGRPAARPQEPLHDAEFIARLNELFPLAELVG
jgi:hypothetical protein